MIPSLRARVATLMVRLVAPRPLPADPEAIIRVTRARWGLPAPLAFLLSRGVTISEITEPARGEWVTAGSNAAVVLYFHGSGYVACSPRTHRSITAALATRLGARVFAPESKKALDEAADFIRHHLDH